MKYNLILILDKKFYFFHSIAALYTIIYIIGELGLKMKQLLNRKFDVGSFSRNSSISVKVLAVSFFKFGKLHETYFLILFHIFGGKSRSSFYSIYEKLWIVR